MNESHVSRAIHGFSALPAALFVCGFATLAALPAHAVPTFQFLPSGTTPLQPEAIGDPGGTNYSLASGWPAGTGLPTALGGWPLVSGTYPPGFAPDVSFGNNQGISGFHSSNLYLTEDAYVRFEFGGSGNAVYQNQFYVKNILVYDNKTSSTSGPNPTASYLFSAGFIPFTYIANVTGTGGTSTYTIVNGSNTANPANAAAFFLGFDPYAVSGAFTTSGTSAVYIGLSDRPEAVPDHDFQDLTVKVTITAVPEPDTLALAVIGAGGGWAWFRRRTRCGRGGQQEPQG